MPRSPTFQRNVHYHCNARLMLLYSIYGTHLKIPGVVECPGPGKKLNDALSCRESCNEKLTFLQKYVPISFSRCPGGNMTY